jgi:hypothetical protein
MKTNLIVLPLLVPEVVFHRCQFVGRTARSSPLNDKFPMWAP